MVVAVVVAVAAAVVVAAVVFKYMFMFLRCDCHSSATDSSNFYFSDGPCVAGGSVSKQRLAWKPATLFTTTQ